MHGYAKIKLVDTSRSKSVDFLDLNSFPHTQKTNENITQNHVSETEKTKQIENFDAKNINGDHFSSEMDAEDGNEKQNFGMKLSRNYTVSSTASRRFGLDGQGSKEAIQSAVKRAFSVRRSSSVSERYCRIHDQCGTQDSLLNGDVEDADSDAMQTRSVKKKKNSGGRILKACKRIFGL